MSHQANPGGVAPDPAVQIGRFPGRRTFTDLTLNTPYAFYVYTCEDANDPHTCGRPIAVDAETPSFGPPHEVIGPIEVTGERRLNRNLRSPEAVIYQFEYSVAGVQTNHPTFGHAQWLEVEWSSSRNCCWQSLVTEGGLSDFVNDTLPLNLRSVFVRVRGANAAGGGPWSQLVEVSFTPYIDSVSGSAGQGSATLNWSSTAGEAGEIDKYQVHVEEYALNRDNPGTDYRKTWTDVDDASATSHTFNNLTPGKTYIMRVRPCKADGSCTYAVRAYADRRRVRGPARSAGQCANWHQQLPQGLSLGGHAHGGISAVRQDPEVPVPVPAGR